MSSVGWNTRNQVPHQVAVIERERQSIRGWRELITTAQRLVQDMRSLKGAQEYRRRIDDLLFMVHRSTSASDLEVLRNTTATADMALALYEAEKALPGKAWLFGRGRCAPGEPLYGFAVFETREAIADGEPIVMVEHDDPRRCVVLAAEKLKLNKG